MVEVFRDVGVGLLVVTVMLSVGCGLEPRQVLDALRRPLRLGVALGFDHLLMPLIAWGIAHALGAPEAGVLAVVLCAATPGGPIGPAFVVQARGDVPFAVSLVVLMAAINVVATPLVLSALGLGRGVEGGIALPLIRTIALYQVLPLCAGMLLRARARALAGQVERVTAVATKVIIGALIAGMLIARWRLFWQIDPRSLAAIVTTCAASVLGGYVLVPGPSAGRRTMAVTAGLRNLGLGLLVAASAFDDEALLGVMTYGLVMMLLVAPVATWLGRRSSVTRPAGSDTA